MSNWTVSTSPAPQKGSISPQRDQQQQQQPHEDAVVFDMDAVVSAAVGDGFEDGGVGAINNNANSQRGSPITALTFPGASGSSAAGQQLGPGGPWISNKSTLLNPKPQQQGSANSSNSLTGSGTALLRASGDTPASDLPQMGGAGGLLGTGNSSRSQTTVNTFWGGAGGVSSSGASLGPFSSPYQQQQQQQQQLPQQGSNPTTPRGQQQQQQQGAAGNFNVDHLDSWIRMQQQNGGGGSTNANAAAGNPFSNMSTPSRQSQPLSFINNGSPMRPGSNHSNNPADLSFGETTSNNANNLSGTSSNGVAGGAGGGVSVQQQQQQQMLQDAFMLQQQLFSSMQQMGNDGSANNNNGGGNSNNQEQMMMAAAAAAAAMVQQQQQQQQQAQNSGNNNRTSPLNPAMLHQMLLMQQQQQQQQRVGGNNNNRGGNSPFNNGNGLRGSGNSNNNLFGQNNTNASSVGNNNTNNLNNSSNSNNNNNDMGAFVDLPITSAAAVEAVEGRVYDTAKDQYGCRYLQRVLDAETAELFAQLQAANNGSSSSSSNGGPLRPSDVSQLGDATRVILAEIVPHAAELMTDQYANFLEQKLFDIMPDSVRYQIACVVEPFMGRISMTPHGTFSVQKLIETIATREEVQVVRRALAPDALTLVTDVHGNHVIQKVLQRFEWSDKQFVYDAVCSDARGVSMNKQGCCVIQRCLEYASPEQRTMIINQVQGCCVDLVSDPFGNYVVQFIIQSYGNQLQEADAIALQFLPHLVPLCRNKFSSNVVEKVLQNSSATVIDQFVQTLARHEVAGALLNDDYGNYVVQRALAVSNAVQLDMMVMCLRPLLEQGVRATPYARKVEAKMEQCMRRRGQHNNNSRSNNNNSGSGGGGGFSPPAPLSQQQHQHHGLPQGGFSVNSSGSNSSAMLGGGATSSVASTPKRSGNCNNSNNSSIEKGGGGSRTVNDVEAAEAAAAATASATTTMVNGAKKIDLGAAPVSFTSYPAPACGGAAASTTGGILGPGGSSNNSSSMNTPSPMQQQQQGGHNFGGSGSRGGNNMFSGNSGNRGQRGGAGAFSVTSSSNNNGNIGDQQQQQQGGISLFGAPAAGVVGAPSASPAAPPGASSSPLALSNSNNNSNAADLNNARRRLEMPSSTTPNAANPVVGVPWATLHAGITPGSRQQQPHQQQGGMPHPMSSNSLNSTFSGGSGGGGDGAGGMSPMHQQHSMNSGGSDLLHPPMLSAGMQPPAPLSQQQQQQQNADQLLFDNSEPQPSYLQQHQSFGGGGRGGSQGRGNGTEPLFGGSLPVPNSMKSRRHH